MDKDKPTVDEEDEEDDKEEEEGWTKITLFFLNLILLVF